MPQDSDSLHPRYPFAAGKGTPLGQLPCFLGVPTRKNTKAGAQLEAALEPLHRLLYGRAGVVGERRAALEAFQGFPDEAEATVVERLGHLKKDKLRVMVQGLGIRQHLSVKVEALAKGVAAFLMAPRDDKVIKWPKTAAAGEGTTGRKSTRDTAEPVAEAPEKKRQRSSSGKPGVHPDTVRAAVFQRVLRMTPAERATLGAKALRAELEQQFHVEEGELKPFKDIIAETASLAVQSLVEAEARGECHALKSNEKPDQTPLQ